jgi:HEAT repeat protein
MEDGADSVVLGLKSPISTVRLQALYAVGNSKIGDHAEEVLQLMKDERTPVIKERCAWVLGRLRHQAAYPYLVANLKHPSPQVRIWSAWALGEIRMDRASKHLRVAIDREPDERVQRAMGGALKKLAGIPTRIHRSKILHALRPPWIDDVEIMGAVAQLETLKWPQNKDEILVLRARIRDKNPIYFAKYMIWLRRKRGIMPLADDDTIVFS